MYSIKVDERDKSVSAISVHNFLHPLDLNISEKESSNYVTLGCTKVSEYTPGYTSTVYT